MDLWCYIIFMCFPLSTVSEDIILWVVVFVYPSVYLSGQILLPRYLVNILKRKIFVIKLAGNIY